MPNRKRKCRKSTKEIGRGSRVQTRQAQKAVAELISMKLLKSDSKDEA